MPRTTPSLEGADSCSSDGTEPEHGKTRPRTPIGELQLYVNSDLQEQVRQSGTDERKLMLHR